MAIETATYILPEHLLCYFHYGDTEGLDDRDMAIIERWEESTRAIHGNFSILSDDEETRDFVTYHALQQYGWLADSCVEMTFAVER